MTKIRIILPLLITLGMAGGALAQLSIGFRSGAQWANVRQTEAIDQLAPDFEYIRSFQGALVAEYAFGKTFALQPELALTRKGFGYSQGVDVNLFDVPLPVGVRAEARFQYLELPVLAKVSFGGEQLRGYAVAGPHLGYALNGKLVTRADGLFDFDISKTNIDLDAINYERLELGATLGAGVAYEAPFGTLFVDARYQHGFSQLYDVPLVNESIRNRGFGVNAGFKVPLGGRAARP